MCAAQSTLGSENAATRLSLGQQWPKTISFFQQYQEGTHRHKFNPKHYKLVVGSCFHALIEEVSRKGATRKPSQGFAGENSSHSHFASLFTTVHFCGTSKRKITKQQLKKLGLVEVFTCGPGG